MDGIPYAIVIPRLFCESFQTLDDYAYKPYYAAFIRWLKYAAFLIAMRPVAEEVSFTVPLAKVLSMM